MTQRLFGFVGGDAGAWRVVTTSTITGTPLAQVKRIDVIEGELPQTQSASWCLRGITSNERYVTRAEKVELVAKQQGLGRPESTCAALIPLRKTAAWWALTQDERRRIFEDQSTHIRTGLKYLPAIARRLQHCRDLGPSEPFDFVTWFEFAPADTAAFDALLSELRASPEWRYVDREIDIRMVRDR
jgi:chlorite dismutase